MRFHNLKFRVLFILFFFIVNCYTQRALANVGWTCADPSGCGGGSVYSQPIYIGPTREQIAQQKAAAERQARLNAAYAQNEQGIAVEKNGDWATAIIDFQNALQNNPDEQVYRANLATAQHNQGIAVWEKGDLVTAITDLQSALTTNPNDPTLSADLATAQQRLQQQQVEAERQSEDKTADSTIQQTIQNYTDTLKNSSAPSGGLDFIGSGQKSSPGILGSEVAKPNDLAFEIPVVHPVSNNPIAQLNSVTFHSLEGEHDSNNQTAHSDTKNGFDTAGEDKGSVLPANDLANPTGTLEMPEIPKGMENNPVIQDGVQRLNKWNSQLQQAQEDVQKAQAAVTQAKDAPSKQEALNALTQTQAKSQSIQQVVDSAKDQIKKQVIYLKKFEVPAPAGNTQKGN